MIRSVAFSNKGKEQRQRQKKSPFFKEKRARLLGRSFAPIRWLGYSDTAWLDGFGGEGDLHCYYRGSGQKPQPTAYRSSEMYRGGSIPLSHFTNRTPGKHGSEGTQMSSNQILKWPTNQIKSSNGAQMSSSHIFQSNQKIFPSKQNAPVNLPITHIVENPTLPPSSWLQH